jgi:small subunit ribosomal protein S14
MTVKQEKKERPYGKGSRKCRRCGTHRGIIRRADLMICRRCMREIAGELGFSKTGSRGG